MHSTIAKKTQYSHLPCCFDNPNLVIEGRVVGGRVSATRENVGCRELELPGAALDQIAHII